MEYIHLAVVIVNRINYYYIYIYTVLMIVWLILVYSVLKMNSYHVTMHVHVHNVLSKL